MASCDLCMRFCLICTCDYYHMFGMKQIDSESPRDVASRLRSEAADLWPAMLGSLSLRRSRCIRENCPACAGIEGRISVLFRSRGMKRCLAEGRERFELWVAAAVLANNLMKVAALMTQRSSRRPKAA